MNPRLSHVLITRSLERIANRSWRPKRDGIKAVSKHISPITDLRSPIPIPGEMSTQIKEGSEGSDPGESKDRSRSRLRGWSINKTNKSRRSRGDMRILIDIFFAFSPGPAIVCPFLAFDCDWSVLCTWPRTNTEKEGEKERRRKTGRSSFVRLGPPVVLRSLFSPFFVSSDLLGLSIDYREIMMLPKDNL